MKKTDIAYVAGFFDGEGSINIVRGRRLYKKINKEYLCYNIRVSMSQSEKKGKEICNWFRNNFEGGVYKVTNKEFWIWICQSLKAYKFLLQIYLYSKLKKEQIILAAEFQQISSNSCGKNVLSEIEEIEKFSYYETAKQEMSFLNNAKIRKVDWIK